MIRPHGWNVHVAFWFLGLINNFTFVLLNTAAEDILKGYAGIILTCTVIPGFLGKLFFSSFAHKLPYLGRIIVVSVSCSACSLIVALASSISAKLCAIVVQSAIGCLGEISFLALTSKYSETTVGAWSSGTGGAGIAGAGLYVVFTQVFGLTSSATLMACAGLPLVTIAIYRSVLETEFEPLSNAEDGVEEGHISQKQYFYTLLTVYMIPLATVYFSEYAINQGVLGTLTKFKDEKDHDASRTYSQLQFVYQIGVFASRSSIKIIRIRALWVLAVLQFANFLILTLSSIYGLLPSFKVAIMLVLWEGLLGGLTYVNAFFRLRTEAPPAIKEWALATASVADATGTSLAALLSIWLEQAILHFRAANPT